MADAVDRFYEAYEEAEQAFRKMFGALRDGGVDMAESNTARRLRSAEAVLGEVRDEVENYGLGGED